MNTIIDAPAWETPAAPLGSMAAELRQLVNVAGPLSAGTAVVLQMVQAAQLAEEAGKPPALTIDQRAKLLAMCHVAAQMLSDASMDACNALLGAPAH